MLTKHQSLIYTMVLMSAADSEMSETEMLKIKEVISYLPIFEGYEQSNIAKDAGAVAELLLDEDGFEKALELVRESLPVHLRETAYALAVEVAAADLEAAEEELNLLQMIRHILEIDRLIAAGIERGARARYAQA
ncbi:MULTISPECIES: tellurite resistance TerB family protein [Curvivirga]|uniref:tellurite resistance TerB family protein n=1 Tax=Curvivirga TaxID=2856846 RepID=UPI0012BC843C|nr:tellurite resistance TerB family protein [Curvivirga aplysinae]MTI10746.1 hypothetical protein [Curvivirga aplysinae]